MPLSFPWLTRCLWEHRNTPLSPVYHGLCVPVCRERPAPCLSGSPNTVLTAPGSRGGPPCTETPLDLRPPHQSPPALTCSWGQQDSIPTLSLTHRPVRCTPTTPRLPSPSSTHTCTPAERADSLSSEHPRLFPASAQTALYSLTMMLFISLFNKYLQSPHHVLTGRHSQCGRCKDTARSNAAHGGCREQGSWGAEITGVEGTGKKTRHTELLAVSNC